MGSISEPPIPSALQRLVSSTPPDSSHPPYLHHLALQVQHNLQHQQLWSTIVLHTHSPLDPSSPLSRPILSGLPPHNVYVHPDDQIDMLKAGIDEKDLAVQREWILPTSLREKWSVARFAEIFDAISEVPTGPGGVTDAEATNAKRGGRAGKRVLLATVDDDSTVVYYIVHDGIVKPRQN